MLEPSAMYRRHHQLWSLVAAVVVGCGAGAATLGVASARADMSAAAGTTPFVADAPPATAQRPALPAGIAPVRLRIPSVGVDAPVAPVSLDQAGALTVPADFAVAGWYSGGPRPGDRGPATIVGHVDSFAGPAVFFRLRDLDAQDPVLVDYSDGRTVAFRIYQRGEYDKDAFPTAAVYANTDTPELRLITCGGPFDRSSRRYTNNIVMWARAE